MTFRNHPTDMMDNPDGRDYHYRFQANDEEAWKLLRHARWKNRYIEMYPRDMKDLRTQIDHVTLKTYDKMGYIKGMKKYAKSPNWQKVPHSRGKAEMKNANGGGTKVSAKTRIGEKWGEHTVDFHVDYTPTEIIEALEDGVHEDAVAKEMAEAKRWAVEEKIDELRNLELEAIEECDHDHVVKNNGPGVFAYCEDCPKGWHDDMTFQHDYHNDELTLVGST